MKSLLEYRVMGIIILILVACSGCFAETVTGKTIPGYSLGTQINLKISNQQYSETFLYSIYTPGKWDKWQEEYKYDIQCITQDASHVATNMTFSGVNVTCHKVDITDGQWTDTTPVRQITSFQIDYGNYQSNVINDYYRPIEWRGMFGAHYWDIDKAYEFLYYADVVRDNGTSCSTDTDDVVHYYCDNHNGAPYNNGISYASL